jgi:hypothetical protein
VIYVRAQFPGDDHDGGEAVSLADANDRVYLPGQRESVGQGEYLAPLEPPHFSHSKVTPTVHMPRLGRRRQICARRSKIEDTFILKLPC